ncbi:MAG: 4Fe-4S binding protein [Candidatus Thermoplasmatota archaeon]|nr:4Fe-4S binding protein [Candidatus Thermoplasmatota archaeon]
MDMDRLAEQNRSIPSIRVVGIHDALCSVEGRQYLRDECVKNSLTGLVIGACPPEVLEIPLAGELEEIGLNKYLLEQVDLREQCAWVHSEKDEAMEKGAALIRGGVQRMRKMEPLEDISFPILPAALIVGGGEAGMQAALDIADAGFKVYRVEDTEAVAGPYAQVDNLEILTGSRIEEIDGVFGSRHVKALTSQGTKAFDVGTILIAIEPRQKGQKTSSNSTGGHLDESTASQETERILKMLHIHRGLNMASSVKLNRGVALLELAPGEDHANDSIVNAKAAAAEMVHLMREKTVSVPRTIARVEEFRCRGCGKCKEVCDYGAITLVEMEKGELVAKIDELRCEGCGICRVACCNGAMALLGYTTSELLANMLGIFEEVGQ